MLFRSLCTKIFSRSSLLSVYVTTKTPRPSTARSDLYKRMMNQIDLSYRFDTHLPYLSTEQMSVSSRVAPVVSSKGAGKLNHRRMPQLAHHRLVTHQNLPASVRAFRSVAYSRSPSHGVCYFFDLLYCFFFITNISLATWSEYAIHLKQDT